MSDKIEFSLVVLGIIFIVLVVIAIGFLTIPSIVSIATGKPIYIKPKDFPAKSSQEWLEQQLHWFFQYPYLVESKGGSTPSHVKASHILNPFYGDRIISQKELDLITEALAIFSQRCPDQFVLSKRMSLKTPHDSVVGEYKNEFFGNNIGKIAYEDIAREAMERCLLKTRLCATLPEA